MKRYLLIFCLLHLLPLCLAQGFWGDVAREEMMRGRVLAVRQTCTAGGARENYLKLFNEQGQYTHRYWLETTGKLSGYDVYEYDAAGLRVKKCHFAATGELRDSFVYRYDTQGNCSYQGLLGADGEVVRWDEFTYDAQQRRISQHSFARGAAGEAQPVAQVFYHYEGSAREASRIKRGERITTQQLNAHGSPAVVEVHDATGKCLSYTRYEYTYDTQGNWMQRRSYNRDGKQQSEQKRDILYR